MPARRTRGADVTDPQTDGPTDPQTDGPTDPQTDGPTDPQTDGPADPQTDGPASEGNGATKPKRGRTKTCKALMVGGQRCEMPEGHDKGDNPTPHNVKRLEESELEDLDLDEDALLAILGEGRAIGVRSAEQLEIDRQVAANFAAWTAAGSDTSKPKWKGKIVAAWKIGETELMLRKAGDIHEPKVGIRFKHKLVGDKGHIAWAAVTRMVTDKDAEESDDSGEGNGE